MNQFRKYATLSALAIGTSSVLSYAAPATTSPKVPQIVGKIITLNCQATLKSGATSGVLMAQGGDQRGYSLYLAGGKPVFAVRQAGKLYTAQSPKTIKGTFSLTAMLQKDGSMTLGINGTTVAHGKAPGLFAVQPKDGYSIGQDTMSAVGNYKAPNAFQGKIIRAGIVTMSSVTTTKRNHKPRTE